MTDNNANGNPKVRRILAPHPWPFLPAGFSTADTESVYYLSWPGWELYLRRRLNLILNDDSPKPLLLPDVADPERDYLYLDQLAQRSAQLGAGTLDLNFNQAEGLFALRDDIRDYASSAGDKPAAGPLLDDRSYLALWAVSEFRSLESDEALARARLSQETMLASLQGEIFGEDDGGQPEYPSESGLSEFTVIDGRPRSGGPTSNPRPERGPGQGGPTANLSRAEATTAASVSLREADARAVYAWKCWRRLTWGLVTASDQIIPTLVLPSED